MKRVLLLLLLSLSTFNLFAQTPQKMSYQAVIRNSSNNLVTNSPVGMKVSILQGSTTGVVVFSESHTPTTNANGLISVEIGGGTNISGSFSNINWGAGPYFVKNETDPTGGTNYTITAISQLLSVPYALFSYKSQIDNVFDGDTSIWKFNGNNLYYKSGLSKVGIGTKTPSAGLDVKAIGETTLNTIIANFEADDSSGLFRVDKGAFVRINTNDYRGRIDLGGSQFTAPLNGASLFHTTGGWQWNRQLNIIGKVGIGKLNDGTADLDISGRYIQIAKDSAGQAGLVKNIPLNTPGYDGSLILGFVPNYSTIELRHQLGGYNGGPNANNFFTTFNTTEGGVSSGERMRISPNGNVGIGTTNPQRTLHVNDVMRLEPRATAPTSPAKGDMYFDSTLNKLRVYDGTTWQNCW